MTARIRSSPEGRWALQVGPRLAIAMRSATTTTTTPSSAHTIPTVTRSQDEMMMEDVVMQDGMDRNTMMMPNHRHMNEDWEMMDC